MLAGATFQSMITFFCRTTVKAKVKNKKNAFKKRLKTNCHDLRIVVLYVNFGALAPKTILYYCSKSRKVPKSGSICAVAI